MRDYQCNNGVVLNIFNVFLETYTINTAIYAKIPFQSKMTLYLGSL